MTTPRLGFAELSFGRSTYHRWYDQSTLEQHEDDLADIDWLGGLAYEEQPWEDGLEASPRPTRRGSPNEWLTDPRTDLPSPELMLAWSEQGALTDEDRMLDELRQREQAREEERIAEQHRRYARVKRQQYARRLRERALSARQQRGRTA